MRPIDTRRLLLVAGAIAAAVLGIYLFGKGEQEAHLTHEKVADGNITWSLETVQCDVVEDDDRDLPPGPFCLVIATVENTSEGSVPIDPELQELRLESEWIPVDLSILDLEGLRELGPEVPPLDLPAGDTRQVAFFFAELPSEEDPTGVRFHTTEGSTGALFRFRACDLGIGCAPPSP